MYYDALTRSLVSVLKFLREREKCIKVSRIGRPFPLKEKEREMFHPRLTSCSFFMNILLGRRSKSVDDTRDRKNIHRKLSSLRQHNLNQLWRQLLSFKTLVHPSSCPFFSCRSISSFGTKSRDTCNIFLFVFFALVCTFISISLRRLCQNGI